MFHLKSLESPFLPKTDFFKKLKLFKAKLDDQLLEQYIAAFTDGQKQLNVHQMSNHYLNRHPFTPVGPPISLTIKPKQKKKKKIDQN